MPRTIPGNAHAWSASHSLEWDIETFDLDAQEDLEHSDGSEPHVFEVAANHLNTTPTIRPGEVYHSPPIGYWLDDPEQPRYTRRVAEAGLTADHRQGILITGQQPQSETIDQCNRAFEPLQDASWSSEMFSLVQAPGQSDLAGLVGSTSVALCSPPVFLELPISVNPSHVSVGRHHCPQDNCAKSFDDENKLK